MHVVHVDVLYRNLIPRLLSVERLPDSLLEIMLSMFMSLETIPTVCCLSDVQQVRKLGYRLETGTAAELTLALTVTLTLTDTGFAVLTLLLGYRRR